MRETICTVSGQRAEAKSNTIRITNDRNNLPNLGEGDQLPDRGIGRRDLLESHSGLSGALGDEMREFGSVSPKVGANTWQAPCGNGRDSRLTFPLKVKVLLISVCVAFVGFVYAIVHVTDAALGSAKISHLTGCIWGLGIIAAYVVIMLLVKEIAAVCDRRITEMGGGR